MRRFLLLVLTVAAALLDSSRACHELFEGDCRAWTPGEQRVGCQAAAFGAFLPTDGVTTPSPLRIAGGDMLACTPFGHGSFSRAIVLVRRGGCAFQEKLVHVAAAGAVGMVLVNGDDSVLQLGTLEFTPSAAFAVSITRSDGDRLIDLVRANTAADRPNDSAFAIQSSLPTLEQAWRRIDYLMTINAPLVAYETFFEALPTPMRDIDKLLDAVLHNAAMVPSESNVDQTMNVQELVAYFQKCADVFHGPWEFEQEASFHASIAAAALLAGESVSQDHRRVVDDAVMKLLGRGYYAHAESLLQTIGTMTTSPATRCLTAFVNFLRGGVSIALELARGCGIRNAQFNVTGTDLEVPHDNFLRLVAMNMDSDSDSRCVAVLSSEDLVIPGSTTKIPCCRRRIHSRTDERHTGEEPLEGAAINRRTFSYQSAFVDELHHTLNIMGVFMDELGAFHESLVFFDQAVRLCEDWSLSTEFRRALAVPIVFDSAEEMDSHMTQLHRNINELVRVRRRQVRILSSRSGVDNYADAFARPEEATYLRYTITPPTMFIGYQGQDVLPLQRAVFSLRAELFPSLNSRFQPLNALFQRHEQVRRRRIAFVSSWFRNHSVGKLILGVIKRLDRAKFHVMVYRAVHFLRASDELTKEFHREADSYMELPVDVADALALLRHEAIDVLVFPELGMDAWTVLLSHHRVAPVQCVFWGHPITTANPAIDYFITSEFFISDFFEGDRQLQGGDYHDDDDEDTATDAWPGAYHGSSFSEQVVLFRGLSTFFTNKFPSGRATRPFQRAALHLPAAARLYVCPQTLMKLHTDFDAVLEAILTRDAAARIVLLASSAQRVWKEQLRRRFRRRFGDAHRRVVFFSTLPYDDFVGLLAAADVVLDPFPFGGGVTTLDALAVGAPVVTLPSAQTVPQLAAGFLRYIGVTDTIARTVDEYVSLALGIAADHTRRGALATRIRAQHHRLYEDAATVDDWDAFLSGVDVDAGHTQA